MGKRNIFIVGLDPFNHEHMMALPTADQYQFHPLLTLKQIRDAGDMSLELLLEQAERTLDKFTAPIDAIIGFWDFPICDMVAILNHRHRLTFASLESVLKCEHKYWSRIEQQAVAPAHVPQFQAVDPFDDNALTAIELSYPFWIKPIKSFASHLGFRIRNDADLHTAIIAIRGGIRKLGDPFNEVMRHANVPSEIAAIDGNHCIIERITSGRQCTLEGYVYHGDINIYGIVDSIREPNHCSFARYQYPSSLPKAVQQEMCATAKRLMAHIGYDNAPFNMEFFYNERAKKTWLLEVNPRISQSHMDLFEKVDGVSHIQVAIDLGLDRRPNAPYRQGDYKVAGKFFIREDRQAHKDGTVTKAPGETQIRQVQKEFPDASILIRATEGMRLSEIGFQDSYTYELAWVFLGADTQQELLGKFRSCRELLQFQFSN